MDGRGRQQEVAERTVDLPPALIEMLVIGPVVGSPGAGSPARRTSTSTRPGWLRPLLIFSCACTPGGFLFLIGILAETMISFQTPVWLILAAAGGVGGYFASKHVSG